MLYNILPSALWRSRGARPIAEPQEKLGFEISAVPEAEELERIDMLLPRSVSKAGSAHFYSVLAQASASDIRAMEKAKAHVISSLAAGPKASATISSAMQLASNAMSGAVANGKVQALSCLVAHDTAGYGPISILAQDKANMEEIEINAPSSCISIYSQKYGRCMTNLRFSGEQAFRSAINRMIIDTDKEICRESPVIDAQVADMRIHAQISPYAVSGAAASIRIGGKKEIGLDYLISSGTADAYLLAYLWLAIESRSSIIISGAPAAGKTTLLGALTAFIPANERVITIEEDISEIRAAGPNNIIALYGSKKNQISQRDQVINSLRLRPDRIIIGEMRGEEARDLFASANMGMAFSATMHSNEGGMSVIRKLMVRPMSVDARSIGALDISIYMRQAGISRRAVSSVCEYRWLSRAETEEGEGIDGQDAVSAVEMLKEGKPCERQMRASKVIESYARLRAISTKEAAKELDRRAKLIASGHRPGIYGSIEAAVTKYEGW